MVVGSWKGVFVYLFKNKASMVKIDVGIGMFEVGIAVGGQRRD
ncbi:MAG: hypothetical protein WBI44_08965 [Syntrophaceticus sp.]